MRTVVPLLLTLSACAAADQQAGEAAGRQPAPFDTAVVVDADGDGLAAAEGDCDDADPGIRPGLDELCDGIDQNCNGLVDEGWPDTDGDGVVDCLEVEDCDGIDNDGNGLVDEGYPDADGDGVADCMEVEDCDGIDNDGNGIVDDGYDADGDGFSPCEGADQPQPDCDDADPSIGPLAAEVDGNLVDDDCDGMIDEGAWAAGDLVITEVMASPRAVPDLDGEWFEVLNLSGRDLILNGLTIVSSEDVGAAVEGGGGLVELPAGAYGVLARKADPEVNGQVVALAAYGDGISLSNEADTLEIWADGVLVDAVSWDIDAGSPVVDGASLALGPIFLDATANDDLSLWCQAPEPWGDGTDLGSPGAENALCTNYDYDGDGYSQDDGDCDETDPSISPGALELAYDGVDNDCDPSTPDDDLDGDGYPLATDCDDLDPLRSPGLPEECDAEGRDEDCDGLANDDDPDIDQPLTWYYDGDGDGYGNAADSVEACSPPAGYSALYPGDCDDADPLVHPGIDGDLDGFDLCFDCDDGDNLVFPYAYEDPSDGIDNDCDGYVDGADPDLPIALSLSDDSSTSISLGFNFFFCGTAYSSVYVISNGRITLGFSSTSYSESESQFSRDANIAMAWDDLNPSTGGTVSYRAFGDAVAVYFRDVPQYGSSDRNTFTAILWEDGHVNLHWERLDTTDFIAGWSCGFGGPYSSSDLTLLWDTRPPSASMIGSGTESLLYELNAPDLDGRGVSFCMRRGTDADGDGWTPDCGDTDDTDPTVHP